MRFIASGLLGVTTWWLEQKRPPSKDLVAKQLHALLRGAMQAAG
ncbi:MAG: TetR family transcriptional regulator C-terminal domain-containing protein [Chloroflexi bacterium]|nr:TetR family transcriptional regulator C-terminal domain-containing protein [Chloroflexota bacterium]